MNQVSQKSIGSAFAIIAAVFWGVSGTCAQYVIQTKGINVEWLVTVRLLISGVLLLGYSTIKGDADIWAIWKNRQSIISLLLFGLLGIMAVQYTYFATIKHSNAATGTVLQYIGPVFIAIYLAIANRRPPSRFETLAILFAFLGTFLLVTHGQFGVLMISDAALFWGILSAIALAFYSIQPVELLKKFDAAVLIGWGMLIGGAGMSFVGQPWNVPGTWDIGSYLAIAFIIAFGTLAAFWLYLAAVKIIGPQMTSLLACAEPLSAALVAVWWLNAPFGSMDWLGTSFVLAAIIILSKTGKHD